MELTYALLIQFVKDGVAENSDEFLDSIDQFITSAEDRIIDRLKSSLFDTTITAELLTGGTVTTRDVKVVAVYDVTAVSKDGTVSSGLERRTYSYVNEYLRDGAVGVPKYYAESADNQFLIAPRANKDYNILVRCDVRPASIDATNNTSWLTRNAPNALKYATMREAEMFNKDMGRAAEWDKMFEEAMGLVLEKAKLLRRDDYSPVDSTPTKEEA